MRIGGRRYRVEWGHLLLVVFIAGVVLAYLLDARTTSLHVNNLLLVQPAAILALILCAVVLPQCFVRDPMAEPPAPVEAQFRRQQAKELLNVAAMAAAFGFFVFSLESVGFDVASWLFVLVGLYICGERRWAALIMFPAAFTAAVVYFFRALVPFPLPTLVL